MILRGIGNPIPNGHSYLNEGNKFNGSENDLKLSAMHQCEFQCMFDLTRFPFDAQKCSIDVQIPWENKNYVSLQPEEVKYSGKNSDDLLYIEQTFKV